MLAQHQNAHAEPVSAIGVSPDGMLLISAGKDRTVKVWDFQTGELRAAYPTLSAILAVGWAPCSRRVIMADRGEMDDVPNIYSFEIRGRQT